MADYGDTSGGYSDDAIRNIVQQLVSNGQPAAQAAPMDLAPQGYAQAAPAAPSTLPGPGGYSPADRFNKFSLPAGGGPLSVDDANKVIASYESTGGHAFAPGPNGYASPAMGAIAAPAASTAPPMGAVLSVPPPSAPPMGGLVAPQSPNLAAATQQMNLSPQEQALYSRHLTNLTGPGGVDNPDGSRSTLYQSVQEHGGKFYNIPTVWNGKRETEPYTRKDGSTMDIPNATALANVDKAGWDNFPSYATPEAADSRYDQMHGYMERDTSDYMKQRGR